jgi:hypothetical protein
VVVTNAITRLHEQINVSILIVPFDVGHIAFMETTFLSMPNYVFFTMPYNRLKV